MTFLDLLYFVPDERNFVYVFILKYDEHMIKWPIMTLPLEELCRFDLFLNKQHKMPRNFRNIYIIYHSTDFHIDIK